MFLGLRSDMGLALRPHVVVSLRLLQYVAVVDLTTNSPVGLLLTATPSGGTGYGADGAGPYVPYHLLWCTPYGFRCASPSHTAGRPPVRDSQMQAARQLVLHRAAVATYRAYSAAAPIRQPQHVTYPAKLWYDRPPIGLDDELGSWSLCHAVVADAVATSRTRATLELGTDKPGWHAMR